MARPSLSPWASVRLPWPRLQPPPRQTERADFPHSAFLMTSRQGLWGLSASSAFETGSQSLLHLVRSRSAFARAKIPSLRSCRSWAALSSRPGLPCRLRSVISRAASLHGRYSASALLPAPPPPSRLRPTSRGRRLYGLPCSGDFSPGRGGFLQLLSMSLSPCCRFHPAEVNSRIGQFSARSFCLRPTVAGSTLGDTHFRGHNTFTIVTAR